MLSSNTLSKSETGKIVKEAKMLRGYAELVTEYEHLKQERDDILSLLEMEKDIDIINLAETELGRNSDSVKLLLERIAKISLSNCTKTNSLSLTMEIRPGVGGEEAMNFAKEMFDMYARYCQMKEWCFDPMDISQGPNPNGIRTASIMITGEDCVDFLRYEGGVHRVQRVPSTDDAGRLHTSTVAVSILPAGETIDTHIDERDLRYDYFKSSGPGGQHVNTTNSAVRVTHVPSGIQVAVQEERNAQQNKVKALEMLKQRIIQQRRNILNSNRSATRSSQIGQAERSEKIRTYNFPQNRITDHRIGKSVFDIDNFFLGKGLASLLGELRQHLPDY